MSVELTNVGHKFAATPWLFLPPPERRCETVPLTAIIGLGSVEVNTAVADWDGPPTEGIDHRPVG